MNVKDSKKLAVVMLLFLAIVYVYYYKILKKNKIIYLKKTKFSLFFVVLKNGSE